MLKRPPLLFLFSLSFLLSLHIYPLFLYLLVLLLLISYCHYNYIFIIIGVRLSKLIIVRWGDGTHTPIFDVRLEHVLKQQ